jgi:anthranilate synthase component 1
VDKYREVFLACDSFVSKVTGHLHEKATTMQVVADTFPAGNIEWSTKT